LAVSSAQVFDHSWLWWLFNPVNLLHPIDSITQSELASINFSLIINDLCNDGCDWTTPINGHVVHQ
jgi:hypothetical protein